MKRGVVTTALGICFHMKYVGIKNKLQNIHGSFGVPFKNFFEAEFPLLHLLQSLCSSAWLYRFSILGSHMRFKMIQHYMHF